MTRYTYPLIVDTVGKLTDRNYLHIFCNNLACRYNNGLDLMAIVRDRGPDYGLDALHAALFCPYCRQSGRPDRNLQWSMGHKGGRAGEYLGDIYDQEMAARPAKPARADLRAT